MAKGEQYLMHNKRGQVTPFIIVGLLVLLGVAVLLAVLFIPADEPTQIEPLFIDEFVEGCIKQTATPLVKEIAKNGGTLKDVPARLFENRSYPYACLFNERDGCVSQIRSRTTIAAELAEEIEKNLNTCLNFESFEEQGFEIRTGEPEVDVSVNVDDVLVTVNFFIRAVRNQEEQQFNKFQTKLPTSFGRMLDLSIQILNDEVTNNNFDASVWMSEHGGEVKIYKQKPYPDTVYVLQSIHKESKELSEFAFAIQGRPSFNLVESSFTPRFRGFCKTDSNCFPNVNPTDCAKAGGTHSITKPAGCEGVTTFSGPACEDGACNDCGEYQHGESWCVYDGPAGKGFDYVGSRHVKQSCIDGQIFTTSCGDFREELCTQTETEPSRAVCRTNRWRDCAAQTSQEACEDEIRDCAWSDFLFKATPFKGLPTFPNKKCHPQVPPGFRFWLDEQQTVCHMANEQFDCDDVSCQQIWVDSVAQYCMAMGDCGNARNIQNVVSINAYGNTDGQERNNTFLSKDEIFKTHILNLPFNGTAPRVTGEEFVFKEGSLPVLADNLNNYLAFASREYTKKKLMKQLVLDGEIDIFVRHTGLCNSWKAPEQASCDACMGDPRKPCSEYRCRSLGNECRYKEEQGFGICFEQETPTPRPKIIAESMKFSQSLNPKSTLISATRGVTLQQGLDPYDPVEVSFETTTPAKCYLDALPFAPVLPSGTGQLLNFMPLAQGLNEENTFNTQHKVIVNTPPAERVREKLQAFGKFTSLLELSSLDHLEQKFRQGSANAIKLAKEFNPGAASALQKESATFLERFTALKPDLEASFSLTSDFLNKVLAGQETNTFLRYVNCFDETGQFSREPFFIKAQINVDNDAPKLLKTFPEPGTNVDIPFQFTATLNEPAECKFDVVDKSFDEMQFDLVCEKDGVFPLFTATEFDCTTEINVPDRAPQLFVRCKDNPVDTEIYIFDVQFNHTGFNVIKGSTINNREYNEFNISGNNFIPVFSDVLETPGTVLGSPNAPITFRLPTEKSQCVRVFDQDQSFEDATNKVTCQNHECDFTLVPEGGSEVIILCGNLPERRNTNARSFIINYN